MTSTVWSSTLASWISWLTRNPTKDPSSDTEIIIPLNCVPLAVVESSFVHFSSHSVMHHGCAVFSLAEPTVSTAEPLFEHDFGAVACSR